MKTAAIARSAVCNAVSTPSVTISGGTNRITFGPAGTRQQPSYGGFDISRSNLGVCTQLHTVDQTPAAHFGYWWDIWRRSLSNQT